VDTFSYHSFENFFRSCFWQDGFSSPKIVSFSNGGRQRSAGILTFQLDACVRFPPFSPLFIPQFSPRSVAILSNDPVWAYSALAGGQFPPSRGGTGPLTIRRSPSLLFDSFSSNCILPVHLYIFPLSSFGVFSPSFPAFFLDPNGLYPFEGNP